MHQLLKPASSSRRQTTHPTQSAPARPSLCSMATETRRTYHHRSSARSTGILHPEPSEPSDAQRLRSSPRRAVAHVCLLSTANIIILTLATVAPRRNASLASLPPATPSTEILQLAISTPPPTPPTALLPLHARARGLLRSTCNNTQAQIAGRETEHAAIFDFLTSSMQGTSVNNESTPSSMFISGSPGTGKTALVTAIIRKLSTEHITDVKVVSINCMALKGLDALWERMIEELSDGSQRKNSAKKLKSREGVRSILADLNVKW